MKRHMYRGQIRSGCEREFEDFFEENASRYKKMTDGGSLMTISLFIWQSNLFLYYETVNNDLPPQELFCELNSLLEDWPGESEKRKWMEMIDIFHFNSPLSAEHWKRKLPIVKRIGRLARVKPEMLSSYIFYHYQLQEEDHGAKNKYCIIGLNENLIFHYEEHPIEVEVSPHKGKLKTSNTPKDWQKFMEPHFIFWDDTEDCDKKLRIMKAVFSF